MGHVEVLLTIDELGFDVSLGEIVITECDMINQFAGNEQNAPQFTCGYRIICQQN